MLFDTAGPWVVLYGPGGQTFALDQRGQVFVQDHRGMPVPWGFVMMATAGGDFSSNDNDFGGCCDAPRAQDQQSIASDEAWFPRSDDGFVMEGPHTPCLPTFQQTLKPDPAASYASYRDPGHAQLYGPVETPEGGVFWPLPSTHGGLPMLAQYAATSSSWQPAYQHGVAHEAHDGFGRLGPDAHGLPYCSPVVPPGGGLAMAASSSPEYSLSSSAGMGSLYGGFSPAGASDLMESMALDDTPAGTAAQSPWPARTGGGRGGGFHGPVFSVESPPWPAASSPFEPTVSPKLLRIVPTPTPTASTDSVNTMLFAGGAELEYPMSAFDMRPLAHGTPRGPGPGPSQLPSAAQQAAQPGASRPPPYQPASGPRPQHNKPSSSSRKQLPDGAPVSRRKATGRSREGTPPTISRQRQGSSYAAHSRQGQVAITAARESRLEQSPLPLPPLPPPPPSAANTASAEAGPSAGGGDRAASSPPPDRARQDEFLVQSKMSGMTYREIKRKGHFAEAESTLRGRFRTLTKNKEARVRKPEWEEKDDQLLRKAVRKLRAGDKVPWKLVAEYIVDNGGSYHFGNTTCRKRYDVLVNGGRDGG